LPFPHNRIPEVHTMSEIETNPAAGFTEDSYPKARVLRSDHSEGEITRLIEQQTAKLPSAAFLLAAAAAGVAAVVLELRGKERLSTIVGMWVPTLMVAGVYNKLIKTVGTR
jgi:hypothetical protein